MQTWQRVVMMRLEMKGKSAHWAIRLSAPFTTFMSKSATNQAYIFHAPNSRTFLWKKWMVPKNRSIDSGIWGPHQQRSSLAPDYPIVKSTSWQACTDPTAQKFQLAFQCLTLRHQCIVADPRNLRKAFLLKYTYWNNQIGKCNFVRTETMQETEENCKIKLRKDISPMK